MHPIIEQIKGGLIVSCQAYPGEPMRNPDTMARIAQAAEIGGACAIRCQGLEDIAAIKERVNIPVIGLWKDGHEGVYITPTAKHALACIEAGSDIVAIDATAALRPDGTTFEEQVQAVRSEADTLIMADCATMEDIHRAVALGCDLVSTTLSHGTNAIDCGLADGPDLPLLREATLAYPDVPVICEGRVHTPEDAAAALQAGAWAVCAGTAITHPASITSWFVAAL